MIRENQQLVANEPVECEDLSLEVQTYKKITNKIEGNYRIYPNLIKENWRMSTCDRLDLQTLGSQPDMFKNLPDHCNLDNLWVSQSSTTPTILHNDECCPPSYGTVGFCVPGGQIRGRHMAVRCQPTYIVGILY